MSRKKKTDWGQNGFEDWGGYMAAKKAKLEEQFHEGANKEFTDASNLFNGIAIFVNGYTSPTADELRRLMMAHGGVYHHYMRPRVTTHIIASNLPYSKIVMYRKSQNPIPICKPEWITDCINAGRILNFQNYLLYSNCTEVQPALAFKVTDTKRTLAAGSSTITSLPQTNNCMPVTKKDLNKNEKQTEASNQGCTKNTARCTKNSEFLSEFYNNSRLHHIATMGATFKDYINELRDKSDGKFPGLERLQKMQRKVRDENYESGSDDDICSLEENEKEIQQGPIIMHIDMDCFFVSVGLRNRPDLRGLPVAVTHAKGNKPPSKSNVDEDGEEYGSLSEVASCSYEARKAGVKNGMFLGQALKMCPNLKTLPYDFEGYKEVSYCLYDTVALYTLDIEAVSCDEMYADCTKILAKSRLTPMEFAEIIREEIRQKTGCPVSAGFGSNKLQARLATKKAKPDGQFYLKCEHVQSYIGTFNIRDLPGVGYSTAYKLNGMNVHTCTELQNISLGSLQKEFGKKTGEILYNMCRGIDNSKLQLEHVRKSVSAEVNYGIRFENNGDAVEFLKKLSEEVCSRLKKANAKGRTITLKMMVRAKDAPVETVKFMGHGPCDYLTRSKNLMTPVDALAIITKEVISLWNQSQQIPEDMRGIGIQISRLEITRHKSNANSLLNFVNNSKQPQTDQKLRELSNHEANKRTENAYPVTKSKNLKSFFLSKDSSSVKNMNDCNNILHLCEPSSSENKHLNDLPDKTNAECAVLHHHLESSKAEIANVNRNQSVLAQANDMQLSNSTLKETSFTKNCAPGKNEKSDVMSKGTVRSADSERKVKNYEDIFVPSQSIDQEVLMALPEDIRNEIIAAETAKRISKNQSGNRLRGAEHKKMHIEQSKPTVKGENVNTSVQPTTSRMNRKNTVQEDRLPSEVLNSDTSNDADIIIPSQEIDESVLNEMPEDIRTEIIIAKRRKRCITSRNDNSTTSDTQRKQEEFFKHTKPNSTKPVKASMPPLQEIDMSVLIELPEDIRNEIFNEYSAKKRGNDNTVKTPVKDDTSAVTVPSDNSNDVQTDSKNALEMNLSFSQVDPEYLAALPEDMKRDVEMYFKVMKDERASLAKKNGRVEHTSGNRQLNGRITLKQDKKPGRTKLKNNAKNAKNLNSKNTKKAVPKATLKISEHDNGRKKKLNGNDVNRLQTTSIDMQGGEAALNKLSQDDVEAIISHNRTITDNDKKADEYQETLINLVNHLFSLPLNQVKMQIETWIARSKDINEVDFLSLATFLSMLPTKKRIEDLHVLLKTMHRCMTETGSCIWHRTYRKTVKHVQHYMQIEYNSNLMVPLIKCNLHKCNGDDVV